MKKTLFFWAVVALFSLLFTSCREKDYSFEINQVVITHNNIYIDAVLSSDLTEDFQSIEFQLLDENNQSLFTMEIDNFQLNEKELIISQDFDDSQLDGLISKFKVFGYKALLTIYTKKEKIENYFDKVYVAPKAIGGKNNDFVMSAIIDNGDFVLCGLTLSSDGDFENTASDGTAKMFIMKVSKDGDILWVKKYNDLDFYPLLITRNLDYYIVAGYDTDQISLLKIDLQGNLITQKKFKDENYKIQNLNTDYYGEIYLSGYHVFEDNSFCEYYAIFSPELSLWDEFDSINFNSIGFEVRHHSLGGYISVGYTNEGYIQMTKWFADTIVEERILLSDFQYIHPTGYFNNNDGIILGEKNNQAFLIKFDELDFKTTGFKSFSGYKKFDDLVNVTSSYYVAGTLENEYCISKLDENLNETSYFVPPIKFNDFTEQRPILLRDDDFYLIDNTNLSLRGLKGSNDIFIAQIPSEAFDE